MGRIFAVFIIIFSIASGFWSCEVPEERFMTFSEGEGLRFSSDSVVFDTLFTTLGSVTRRLKVFNDRPNAIKIEHIHLAGTETPFRVWVNGQPLEMIQEQVIIGGDSMLVLVEVTIDPMDENLPFLVTEDLIFISGPVTQSVKLVAWGQDAVFLGNQSLECGSRWTNDRPYVLTGSVLVDSLCVLEIDAGARIFAVPGAYLFVRGSMQAEGTAADQISFLNIRQDPPFNQGPGQWGGLIFLEGTFENIINHVVIRNSEYGFRIGAPDEDEETDLKISNTIIENTSIGGVVSFTSDIHLTNVLIKNSIGPLLGVFAGGNVIVEHCTFANFGFGISREEPVLVLSNNIILSNGELLTAPLNASLLNTIIWGDGQEEIALGQSEGVGFSVEWGTNLLKTQQEIFQGGPSLINQNPLFVNPSEYDYRIQSESPARGAGVDIGIETDILGQTRSNPPDLGAYSYQPE